MTAYWKGKRNEYYVERLLKRFGYRYIIKSQGSRGPGDILASNGEEILYVQVKEHKNLSDEERIRLTEWAYAFHAIPAIAFKRKRRWRLELL